jgi:hypothetical protein
MVAVWGITSPTSATRRQLWDNVKEIKITSSTSMDGIQLIFGSAFGQRRKGMLNESLAQAV